MTKLLWSMGILLILMIFTACASKNKAKEVDTKIKNPAPVAAGGVIGVKDGDMVYQKKVQMNEELRHLELTVYNLEAKVFGGPRYLDNRGLYGVLRDCRADKGDADKGGDGRVGWVEKREYVTPEEDFTTIGLEKNRDIVGVSEEYLLDRIERFKGYKKILESRQDEYETKVRVCEAELKVQRR